MPRISGPDIATHVAHQEAAVLAAATALFVERGYSNVSLGDIARAVGLARTSLYRYYPDKDHILLAWMKRDMEELLARCDEVADDRSTPAPERLRRWMDVQFDFLADPQHAAVMAASSELTTMAPEVQEAAAVQHRRLYAGVQRIVGDALGVPGNDPLAARTATWLAGLLRTANDLLRAGVDTDTVHAELLDATDALVAQQAGHR